VNGTIALREPIRFSFHALEPATTALKAHTLTHPSGGWRTSQLAPIVILVEFGVRGGENPINGVAVSAIRSYASAATLRAHVEELEPGYWYAASDEFNGVWGDGSSPMEALIEFEQAAAGWVALKLRDGDDDIPVISGSPLSRNRG